jgi:transcriptional regulator with XRE-family HTH domain
MSRRGRRTSVEVAGAAEAARLALTLGAQARATRRRRQVPLRVIARQLGISVTRLGELERGEGAGAPVETWVRLGMVLGRPLAVTFSRPIDEPRSPSDSGHLEIQEHILALARATGRTGTFELPTRPADPSRSTDLGLNDPTRHERIHVECWNTFGDLGAAVRATNRKVAEAEATWPDDRIATVWVVRATAANRALLARYPNIIDAAFPGSSRAWVRSLTSGTPPPERAGMVWFDPSTGHLTERRRATIAA